MEPLDWNEIKGNWATLLLPILPSEAIDFDCLSDEIDRLIDFGVSGIYSNGTAGEFYNQTEAEFDRINQVLAEKCTAAGMPFQIGASHMSPVISLERIRRSVGLEPGAIQVILPDWFPVNMDEARSFLEKAAGVADPIGLVLYNPPHAKVKLGPEEFGRLKAAVPGLKGIKVAGGDPSWFENMKRMTPQLSIFIAGHTLASGFKLGASGSYSNVCCLHPGAAQRWWELINDDPEAALEMQTRIQAFLNGHIRPLINDEGYSNQSVDKLMAVIGSWSGLSPRLRWPYRWIPTDTANQLRKNAQEILPEFFPEKS